jgi:hypothetical protein
MPRPDKEINPGRLDGPASSSRSHSWTKYGGAETAEPERGAPSTVEVTVDDITVIGTSEDVETKYTTRGTAAHGIGIPDEKLQKKRVEFVREWVIDRKVEGRTYWRTDTLVMVELGD